ncbi:MAG TPA: hypothetical protein VEK08_23675 [Planctomycetota bacterium]|nr:hypothetical protein [Planctomycetota bacterium]
MKEGIESYPLAKLCSKKALEALLAADIVIGIHAPDCANGIKPPRGSCFFGIEKLKRVISGECTQVNALGVLIDFSTRDVKELIELVLFHKGSCCHWEWQQDVMRRKQQRKEKWHPKNRISKYV